LLLTAVRDGWLRLTDVARVCCAGPAAVWGIAGKGAIAKGMDGDVVVVDPRVGEPLPEEWLRSRAGYSPYVGTPLAGWPRATVLRGVVTYRDHAPAAAPLGQPLRFTRCARKRIGSRQAVDARPVAQLPGPGERRAGAERLELEEAVDHRDRHDARRHDGRDPQAAPAH